jgi:SAM-dependent methyltransferase
MEVTELQQHWDRLAQRDPFWAILTRDDKRDGGWAPGEFFADGIRDIDQVLLAARRFGFAIERRRALDFGCGAGRLTQALCAHFERGDGVDISPAMLALARQHNRYPERCHYHLNQTSDLRIFPDGAFSFICSFLVLQHVPKPSARDYIREFVRVLAPGGLLVFQIPGEEAGVEPLGARGVCSAAAGPLAADSFRAKILIERPPATASAGRALPVRVTIQNLGRGLWPALPGGDTGGHVTLGNQWRRADGSLLVRDDARALLPRDLAPREDLELWISPTAPLQPGHYLLDFDMVQEGVCWFGERDSDVARLPIVVTPAPATPADSVPLALASESVSPVEVRPRFRERHPSTFAWLERTGGLELIRAIERVLRPEPLPDWRAMEMNCLPLAEVESLIEAAGAHIIVAERHPYPGFKSYRYWVVRSG